MLFESSNVSDMNVCFIFVYLYLLLQQLTPVYFTCNEVYLILCLHWVIANSFKILDANDIAYNYSELVFGRKIEKKVICFVHVFAKTGVCLKTKPKLKSPSSSQNFSFGGCALIK